jgi:hypothetical protein
MKEYSSCDVIKTSLGIARLMMRRFLRERFLGNQCEEVIKLNSI